MNCGDGCGLLDTLRVLSDRLLPHIVRLLPSCVHSLGTEVNEDAITRNLVSGLAELPEVRKIGVLDYHFEPFRVDDRGNRLSTGQIDFVLRPFGVWNRELYIAYECKRLNVTGSGGIRSGATEYVLKGVSRFVAEQYSARLPLACMLGYVEDGKVLRANLKVRDKIDECSTLTSIIGPPITLSEDVRHVQFETVHSRLGSSNDITIRHQLVSCIL